MRASRHVRGAAAVDVGVEVQERVARGHHVRNLDDLGAEFEWLEDDARLKQAAARSQAPPPPAPSAAEELEAPAPRPRTEYLAMSLLDDEDVDASPAPDAPKAHTNGADEAASSAEAVDEQSESPILPRLREQEEGV